MSRSALTRQSLMKSMRAQAGEEQPPEAAERRVKNDELPVCVSLCGEVCAFFFQMRLMIDWMRQPRERDDVQPQHAAAPEHHAVRLLPLALVRRCRLCALPDQNF